jgi:iron complex transport system substrate-binding protein
MRIVSLLPSATEIVYALGLAEHLVGVTDECDWPPQARTVRVVSRSALPPVAEPAEIDRLVSASISGGQPLYRRDTDAIQDLRPDLVLAQDLCAVCAVPSGQVTQALDEVLDGVLEVGKAAGVQERAEEVVAGLRERLARVQAAVEGLERPRVFALEWGDPPFNGGHWVPEMLQVAGAEALLASPGAPSVRVSWAQIEAAAPQVVVFMPCGYGLQAAVEEATGSLLGRPELAGVEAIVAVDASAYCSRPGPRLVDGAEILAAALHPGQLPPPPGAPPCDSRQDRSSEALMRPPGPVLGRSDPTSEPSQHLGPGRRRSTARRWPSAEARLPTASQFEQGPRPSAGQPVNVTCWHQPADVSAGRTPHSSPDRLLNAGAAPRTHPHSTIFCARDPHEPTGCRLEPLVQLRRQAAGHHVERLIDRRVPVQDRPRSSVNSQTLSSSPMSRPRTLNGKTASCLRSSPGAT